MSPGLPYSAENDSTCMLKIETGICRGNEDSHRNENRKSLEKIFSQGKKIDKHTIFL